MVRRDGPAIRDTAIWLGSIIAFGGCGVWFWGSWLAVPFFLCYGVLCCSVSDSRWHECGHRTAFKTPWMNEVVYQIASFLIMRDPTITRRSHMRHHADTLIVGRDPEITVKRPPSIVRLILGFAGLVEGMIAFQGMARHAAGGLNAEEEILVPERERPAVYRTARIWVAIYGTVVLACAAAWSVLPAVLVGLPYFYGTWLQRIFGLTQHAGLAEDVLDHRLNSRTVHMNPLFRFLYWNMNYHVEHHMFPMVPYHRLPDLHRVVKADLPTPYAGVVDAFREIIPAIIRQRRDPDWHVRRPVPTSERGTQ